MPLRFIRQSRTLFLKFSECSNYRCYFSAVINSSSELDNFQFQESTKRVPSKIQTQKRIKLMCNSDTLFLFTLTILSITILKSLFISYEIFIILHSNNDELPQYFSKNNFLTRIFLFLILLFSCFSFIQLIIIIFFF